MAALPRHLWVALFIERHAVLRPYQVLTDLLAVARQQWVEAGYLDPVEAAEAMFGIVRGVTCLEAQALERLLESRRVA